MADNLGATYPTAATAPKPRDAVPARPSHRFGHRKDAVLLMALGVALLVTALAALGIGAVPIGLGGVAAILVEPLGITLPWGHTDSERTVLETIRAPRVALGALVGAGLGVAGAAMQGLFRNPLADPALVGVSSGAALAAVSMIVLGATVFKAWSGWLGLYALPVAAFAGGVLATLVVYRFANVGGRTVVASMLLAGIAVNAIAAALTGALTFIADDAQLRTLTFWTLGSLGGASWERVGIVFTFLLIPLILIPRHARALNALLLGESEAMHLGYDLERLKRRIVLLVALCVGAAVSMTGIIGFIGLVVPHLIRLAIGPDHRALIPASALLGATLLLLADLLARTAVAPAELPIGIVTAAIGGPFFLWLLGRRQQGSGWR
ncbi:MAG: FecCD family ABC transporter permease [Thiotrichales bacterium]